MKTAISIIAAIILTLVGILGSIKLKSLNLISEPFFVLLLICSVLIGLFIVYSDKIKVLDFYKGQLILRDIKETEASVKELAKAILEVTETSSHAIMTEGFDGEAKKNAVEKLRKLTS